MRLCDPNMRYRLECLCFDCRQRGLQFQSKRPENRLDPAIINYQRGVDDYYFANGFLIDNASLDLLAITKLREDAFNTTAMAICCGTYMCGTHPVYEGGSVSVNADSCRVNASSIMPNQSLLFGCDFPAERYAAVCERSNVPKLYSVYDEGEHEEMIRFIKIVTEPLAKKYQVEGYVTFEKFSEGKPVIIDNSFFDESRSAAKS